MTSFPSGALPFAGVKFSFIFSLPQVLSPSSILLKRSLASLFVLFLAGCVSEVTRLVDDVRVVARIGVLADVNLRGAGEVQMLKKAFEFYRQEGVDAVAVVGTVPTAGAAAQRERMDDVWRQVFAGSSVPLFLESGRHEVKGVPFATAEDRPVGKQDVLTFYGKRRLALTDELCAYPRGSRTLCAGSMSGLDLPAGYEDKALEAKLAKSAQGLLVSVYADKTVVRRLDFTQKLPLDSNEAWRVKKDRLVYAEDVAAPWVVGADGKVAMPEQEIPEFWSDTRLQVIPGYVRTERVYTVKWPSLLQRHVGARARWYVVEAAFADESKAVFLSRTILSDGYHQSEDRDKGAVKTVIRTSELPSASEAHKQVVFRVTPVGAFGKSGKSLVSEPISLPTP